MAHRIENVLTFAANLQQTQILTIKNRKKND